MSRSSSEGGVHVAKSSSVVPRATIHKQVLDAAASMPNASLEAIATSVCGASVSLVEKVLGEYGDPAQPDSTEQEQDEDVPQSDFPTEETKTGLAVNQSHMEDKEFCIDSDQLTREQLQTLQAIYNHPDATQARLGELLDVSGATINQRVNSIDGFDWSRRHRLVNDVFEKQETEHEEKGNDSEALQRLAEQLDEIARRVQAIEQQLDEWNTKPGHPVMNLTLIHEVTHACMQSDHISEEGSCRY